MFGTVCSLRFAWSLAWTAWVGLLLFRLMTAAPAGSGLWPSALLALAWALMVLPRYWWPGRVAGAVMLMAGLPVLNVALAWALPLLRPDAPALPWADVAARTAGVWAIGAAVWAVGMWVARLRRKAAAPADTQG